jgi:hypothetical protein
VDGQRSSRRGHAGSIDREQSRFNPADRPGPCRSSSETRGAGTQGKWFGIIRHGSISFLGVG